MARILKERMTVSLNPLLVGWIDERVSERVFANRSNAVEFCVMTISELSVEELIRMKMKAKKKKKS